MPAASGVCATTIRWPLASSGIWTSVMMFPSFQRTFIAVVDPKPNGRSWVPSGSSISGGTAGAGSSR